MGLTPEQKANNLEERRKNKYNKTHKIINGIDHKLCNIHHKYFPDEKSYLPATLEYFYENKTNSIDGLSTRCKKCEVKKAMEWKIDNPEKLKQSNKKSNNSIHGKKRKRKCEKRRRDNGKVLEWQQQNTDKIKKYNENRRHKNHNINKKEWLACKEYFNNACAYCELPKEEHFILRKGKLKNYDLHKEHVEHEGNNDLSNCVPSCQICNSEKHSSSLEEWYNDDNINFTQERYNKIQKWIQEDHKQYIDHPNQKGNILKNKKQFNIYQFYRSD